MEFQKSIADKYKQQILEDAKKNMEADIEKKNQAIEDERALRADTDGVRQEGGNTIKLDSVWRTANGAPTFGFTSNKTDSMPSERREGEGWGLRDNTEKREIPNEWASRPIAG